MIFLLREGGDMGKVHIGRVLLGGIVAGIVVNILGYLVDGLMLAPRWAAALKTLGRPEFSVNQIVGFNLIGLLYGILVVGLYAVMRSHFGAGPKTAVYAGLGAWAMGILLPNASLMVVAGLFPRRLAAMTTAAAIIESVAAALAGAALYKEGASSARSMAARA
jgi:hypothetical protein